MIFCNILSDEGHRISIKEEDITDDEVNLSPSQIQNIIRGYYGTKIEDHSKADVVSIAWKLTLCMLGRLPMLNLFKTNLSLLYLLFIF